MIKKKSNKDLMTWIVGVASVVVLVAVIVIALVLSNNNINESFFVSDDTKSVLELDASEGLLSADISGTESMPEKAYLVFFYSGDEVTGQSIYYEYSDQALAKKNADYLKSQKTDDEMISKILTNGKYVVVMMSEKTFEGMTSEDAKRQIEFMETMQKINLDEPTS
ncbi:hypothetical protein IKF03_02085 [Candidatus Saccharibacteria bacterium]|nr:hypothetical protein [Candidatus Saccharibacteria bacterium]